MAQAHPHHLPHRRCPHPLARTRHRRRRRLIRPYLHGWRPPRFDSRTTALDLLSVAVPFGGPGPRRCLVLEVPSPELGSTPGRLTDSRNRILPGHYQLGEVPEHPGSTHH